MIDYGRVRCTNRAGRAQEIGANFLIGIMDSLAQVPRSFDAVTDTLVVANRVDLDAFLGVLETHIELARDFLAFLAHTVLDLQASAREGA